MKLENKGPEKSKRCNELEKVWALSVGVPQAIYRSKARNGKRASTKHSASPQSGLHSSSLWMSRALHVLSGTRRQWLVRWIGKHSLLCAADLSMVY